MHQRFREIAEANHRLQHPFTVDKIQLLGKVAGIAPRMNHLDLSCGNGELLVQWAAQFNIYGVGIDAVGPHKGGRRNRKRIGEAARFID